MTCKGDHLIGTLPAGFEQDIRSVREDIRMVAAAAKFMAG